MNSKAMNEILQSIEDQAHSAPSAIEFEMAYQARVAIDRIKFAIRHTEQFAPRTDQMFEASIQLLDAVERLEAVDRRFQSRSLKCRPSASALRSAANGRNGSASHDAAAEAPNANDTQHIEFANLTNGGNLRRA